MQKCEAVPPFKQKQNSTGNNGNKQQVKCFQRRSLILKLHAMKNIVINTWNKRLELLCVYFMKLDLFEIF